AVDRNPAALDAARRAGAEHTLLADGRDVPAAVHDLTGGGAHVSVDAVGSEPTCADAVLSLRRRGRHVQVGLFAPVDGGPRVPLDAGMAGGLDRRGSAGVAATDCPGMRALLASGALRPRDPVDRVVGLHEAAARLPAMDTARRAGMVVLDPRRD